MKKMNFCIIILVTVLGFIFTPQLDLLAQGNPACDPASSSATLCNPLSPKDASSPRPDNLQEFFYKALAIFAGFTVLIPIIAIVFAGLLMIVSRGNPESVTRAKSTLAWSAGGFVLAVGSYLIIAATIQFLGATNIPDYNDPSLTDTAIINPLRLINPFDSSSPSVAEEFPVFLKIMLFNTLQIIGALAVLMLIINGFRYITASGNEEQAKSSKQGILWAVVGILTVLFAFVIIRALATALGLP